MSTPKTEPSTKKAFNFPKSAAAKSTKSSKSTAKDAKPASEKPKKSAPKTASPASKTKSKAVESKVVEQPAQTVEAATTPLKAGKSKATGAKPPKKEKVVRDSFTMPRSDYAKLASLKQKCSANGLRVKKSELLRAALTMLDAAPDKRVVAAVKALETVKTGRPANS